MSHNPSLVMIPGAWHGSDTWDKLISVLEKHGLKSVAVDLPTTQSNPEATLEDDVNATRDAIIAETSQGRDVVVVFHSYGGVVGSSAVKGLTKPEGSVPSSNTSGTGHVIGLFMIATGFMVRGITFLDGAGGKPPPFWKEDTETGFAPLLVDTRELFYHDLPEDEGKLWVSKLRNHSMKAFTTGADITYDGWKEVPVWYLVTKDDKALPAEVQKMFVKDAQAAGGDVTQREIDTSHSPMLSKPEETADIIVEAVKAFTQ
ncbi:Alpha/beta hydrolase fold-1 [Mariannaea sp. PMI_226]|nr:Alpha/beta hydrolase fold-1 [Mariannaea sp. PMI_226]